MKAIKTTRTLLGVITLAAVAVQTSSAQPSGISLTNHILYATNVLWDVSLITKLQQVALDFNSGKVQVMYADTFTQNGGGKLLGSGTNVTVTLISDGITPTTFPGKYTTSGSVTSSKGVLHLTFTTRVSGKAMVESALRNLSASINGTVVYDRVNNTLAGRTTAHASASGLGAVSKAGTIDNSDLADLTSELGDGTWTLQITFGTANVNKLSGTASVTLNSGQVYPFSFTGTYNPKTQESKLNLKGIDAGKGSLLQVTLDGTDLTRITGRVSGQSVSIK